MPNIKRHFYVTLVVLAVLLLALPGLIAKGIKGVTHRPPRPTRRLTGVIGSTPVSRPST